MSEKKTKKLKLRVIPDDKIVDVKFSGHFHKRIMGVYFNYIKKIDTLKFERIVQHIEKNEEDKLSKDEFTDAVCLKTLLALLMSIEKEFTDAKLDIEQEYEVPIED